MPRFAANLSMLYPELDFLDRFEAASMDGFDAVEFLFPYAYEPSELKARLQANGLQQVLFNAPPGDWEGGERGLACLPGREAEFREGVSKALAYAEALDCPRVHVMAGLVPEGVERETLQPTYIENLRWAAAEAEKVGRDVLIEPINTRDIPRFFLNRQDHAHEIVEAVGSPNLKVQMDLYHCQIVEGDVTTKLYKYLPTGRVGHIQIAGVPTRNEPHIGELDYTYIFRVIDDVSNDCGWKGWVGCEYRPYESKEPGGTSMGLTWYRKLPRF
ncbi:2-oxo-tetronate isomerase [Variovorax sp. KK3]|uniref:2-oxo-tetronate isomerase n=1 Tax=Variovorax sp. KK3 TaxID=1855728 RepID=UPI00097C7A61|nr:2-oxo-tetronate isomerase [Variovorax sp. KK3]